MEFFQTSNNVKTDEKDEEIMETLKAKAEAVLSREFDATLEFYNVLTTQKSHLVEMIAQKDSPLNENDLTNWKIAGFIATDYKHKSLHGFYPSGKKFINISTFLKKHFPLMVNFIWGNLERIQYIRNMTKAFGDVDEQLVSTVGFSKCIRHPIYLIDEPGRHFTYNYMEIKKLLSKEAMAYKGVKKSYEKAVKSLEQLSVRKSALVSVEQQYERLALQFAVVPEDEKESSGIKAEMEITKKKLDKCRYAADEQRLKSVVDTAKSVMESFRESQMPRTTAWNKLLEDPAFKKAYDEVISSERRLGTIGNKTGKEFEDEIAHIAIEWLTPQISPLPKGVTEPQLICLTRVQLHRIDDAGAIHYTYLAPSDAPDNGKKKPKPQKKNLSDLDLVIGFQNGNTFHALHAFELKSHPGDIVEALEKIEKLRKQFETIPGCGLSPLPKKGDTWVLPPNTKIDTQKLKFHLITRETSAKLLYSSERRAELAATIGMECVYYWTRRTGDSSLQRIDPFYMIEDRLSRENADIHKTLDGAIQYDPQRWQHLFQTQSQ